MFCGCTHMSSTYYRILSSSFSFEYFVISIVITSFIHLMNIYFLPCAIPHSKPWTIVSEQKRQKSLSLGNIYSSQESSKETQ